MSKIWLNPNPNTNSGGEGGGGGTPSIVEWSDIKNKPTEFIPTEHTHVIADIKDLAEILESIQEGVLTLEEGAEVTLSLLEDKVDKVEGKELSSNDYTDEEKENLLELVELKEKGLVLSVNGETGEVNISKDTLGLSEVINVKQASEEEFKEFQELILEELENKVEKVDGKSLSTNDFTDEHLSNLLALDNEVDRILELLGEGETGIIQVIKKGHLYSIGNTIYDIVNRNKVTGLASYRFVYDNINLFENNNFRYNEIYANITGDLANVINDINAEHGFWEGALKGVIDINKSGTFQLKVNGKERRPQEVVTKFEGNRIYFDISSSFFDEETKLVNSFSIVNNLYAEITTEDGEKNLPVLYTNNIVNNDIYISSLEEFTNEFKQTLHYKGSTEEVNQLLASINLRSNVIEISGELASAHFSYTNENAKPFKFLPGLDMFICAGVYTDVTFNKFNKEISKRFQGEIVYSPERMEDPDKPVFTNVTMEHYLSKSLEKKANIGENNEFAEIYKAQSSIPKGEVALRNTVVVNSLEEIPKEYIKEGLIAIVIEE